MAAAAGEAAVAAQEAAEAARVRAAAAKEATAELEAKMMLLREMLGARLGHRPTPYPQKFEWHAAHSSIALV